MDPLSSLLTLHSPVDLKANGEVSRMRSHRGNIPSLPQTKCCPLCPAKFTRTTHLNRHIRSHTNERHHRCSVCHAEFTRSDLLTRHKRTCGDSVNTNRSRRKSCQACAESKVKCNLESPCSKCTSRGRECIFINDPEVSRNKKLTSAKRKLYLPTVHSSVSVGSVDSSSVSTSNLFSESLTDSPTEISSVFPSISPTTSISVDSVLSHVPSLSTSLVSSTSSSESSHSSPRSDVFETQPDVVGTFDTSLDAFHLDSYVQGTFTGELFFDPSLTMTTCSSMPPACTTNEFHWFDGNDSLLFPNLIDPALCDDQLVFPQTRGFDDQVFIGDFGVLMSTEDINILDPSPRTSEHSSGMEAVVSSFFDQTPMQSLPSADLSLYLSLFFSAFCAQVPLVHVATWTAEGKPPLLVRAMQACGALFVRTAAAAAFIEETLSSTRDALVLEFAKLSSDPLEQQYLLLTVVLLQTIGLFHQKAGQRISSNVYHGMLVMMIRRTNVISRVNAWVPSDNDMSDVQLLDTAWREWANHEMIKRVLFLSYLHDCCHCMYFAIPPSFHPSELDLCLPCDDILWGAPDAAQWFKTSRVSSPYGTGNARIVGFPMQTALAVLSETRLSTVTLVLNHFAHFILIHTILRNIYVSEAGTLSVDISLSQLVNPSGNITSMTDGTGAGGENRDDSFVIQYALHNWLQTWLGSPEFMLVEQSNAEPPFIQNALPFYWLAQVSLLAIQDGTAGFGFSGRASDARAEGRFRLLKMWLDRIRAFLRSGSGLPTHLLDELLMIRTQISVDDVQGGDEHPNGLLAFFPGSGN